jgi:hypothetical protein
MMNPPTMAMGMSLYLVQYLESRKNKTLYHKHKKPLKRNITSFVKL